MKNHNISIKRVSLAAAAIASILLVGCTPTIHTENNIDANGNNVNAENNSINSDINATPISTTLATTTTTTTTTSTAVSAPDNNDEINSLSVAVSSLADENAKLKQENEQLRSTTAPTQSADATTAESINPQGTKLSELHIIDGKINESQNGIVDSYDGKHDNAFPLSDYVRFNLDGKYHNFTFTLFSTTEARRDIINWLKIYSDEGQPTKKMLFETEYTKFDKPITKKLDITGIKTLTIEFSDNYPTNDVFLFMSNATVS